MEVEYDYSEFKYIYCVEVGEKKLYYIKEYETRFAHELGYKVSVIRCIEGSDIYKKAFYNTFHW